MRVLQMVSKAVRVDAPLPKNWANKFTRRGAKAFFGDLRTLPCTSRNAVMVHEVTVWTGYLKDIRPQLDLTGSYWREAR